MLKKEKKKVADFLANPTTGKPPVFENPLNSTLVDVYPAPKTHRQICKLKTDETISVQDFQYTAHFFNL
jgi:hypothetical protein